MSHPFDNLAAKPLLDGLASLFKESNIFFRPGNKIVFVCGAGEDAGEDAKRKKFLNYADQEIKGARFLLAEAATYDIFDYQEPRSLNLSEFEQVIAEIADLILIFPESVGSYAETGLFSAIPEITRKCLVVNGIEHQEFSFLYNGPIQTINETSIYRPNISLDFNSEPVNFGLIKQKIDTYKRQYRTRIKMSDSFMDLKGPHQFGLINYLINLFPSIDYEGIRTIISLLFKSYKQNRIQELLSIIIASNYASRSGNDPNYCIPNRNISPFIEIDGANAEEYFTTHYDFYKKYYPDLIPQRARR